MDETPFVDYYELLQISPNADDDTIHRVFRLLAKKHHPDTEQGDAKRFNLLVEAYRTLANPETRVAYDVRHEQYWDRTWKVASEASDRQAFVDDGGYRRREWWGRRGWDWRRREGAEHPLFWSEHGRGRWFERRFDRLVPLDPWQPVVHVNWYEAEAFCRWAGRRLPTEVEWEMAATLDPATGRKHRFPWGEAPPTRERANLDYLAGAPIDVRALPDGDSPVGCRQMVGNVWEWVADTFGPYPGFACDPYKEYSEPHFGGKHVLKGGCWTTRSRLIRGTWRNFFKRQRRNVIAGFRTAAR